MKTKSKNKLIIILGMLLCGVFFSCTTFKADGLAFMTLSDNTEILGHFSTSKTVHEFLGKPAGTNLFNISSGATADKINSIIWKEIQDKGGNAAINIKITYRATLLNHLGNWITFGIWAPGKIHISGDVIRTSSQTALNDMNKEIEVALKQIEKDTSGNL